MELQAVDRQLRCLTAAIGQVAVRASGRKSATSVTWSPWLIQTVGVVGHAGEQVGVRLVTRTWPGHTRGPCALDLAAEQSQASCMP
jgi:hypothetical protein